MSHRRSDIIRRHENGAKHDTSSAKMLQREHADVSKGHSSADSIENDAEAEGAHEDADGNMPADNL